MPEIATPHARQPLAELPDLQRLAALHDRLAGHTAENQLLTAAVTDLRQAFNLHHATCYAYHPADAHWVVSASSDADQPLGHHVPPDQASQLDALRAGTPQAPPANADGREQTAVFPLTSHGETLGALAVHGATANAALQPLLQLFAQQLASLWHACRLRAQAEQQTQEVEILQGRQLSGLWQTEYTVLEGQYGDAGFHIKRNPESNGEPLDGRAIPLSIGDNPFGEITIPHGVSLQPEQLGFIEALVREMGNALNNAFLLQATRTYANQLALATGVSRAATTILDLDLLIQEVVNLIRSGFDLYYVGLFLVDEDSNMAVLQAGTGEAGRLQVERHHQLAVGGPSMIGTAVAQGKAIVEQDVARAAAFTFNPVLPRTRSELALPLQTRGKTIGALTVQSDERYAFAHETVAVLQNLADQLAIAIETAVLFATTQDTLAETSRLYETSRRMSAATAPQDVYQALIDFAALSGSFDAAQLLTQDPADENHLIAPALWSRTPILDASHVRYDRAHFRFFGEHLFRSQLVLLEDTRNDPRLDDATRAWFTRHGLHASALIPLTLEGKWLATLALHFTNPRHLAMETLQPLLTLADQAAVILNNRMLLRELHTANEQLRQLDKLKTQFLANMSHELRTPLNSIIGFSRVILKGIDGPITSEQEEDLTSIHTNGQHLLRLINEILDMAKIEAGKMVLSFETIDLHDVVQSTVTALRSLADGKHLTLTWDVSADVPPISADPVRLRQILNNLLSNAIKYTDAGFVSLTVQPADEEHVRITVSDSGIGISQGDFDKLFAAFEQVDSSTTRAVGGTGLGLPITKWLVSMHHGTISVESEIGRGSTFHVLLPIAQVEPATAQTTSFDDATT
ncbi:MAG: GAF domain-containing protein [Anaerolineales bacterium]|nr:GAF domain-containing protein [Anaerolineales bacterium]